MPWPDELTDLTASFPPENQWLEDEISILGMHYFQVPCLVCRIYWVIESTIYTLNSIVHLKPSPRNKWSYNQWSSKPVTGVISP